MDTTYWLMLFSRVLHILSAIVLVGGIFYLRMIVAPAAAANEESVSDPWFGGRRSAWAMWVGITTLVLLVTGLWNFMQIVQTHEKLGPHYHAAFGIKLLLSLAVFFLAAMLAGKSRAGERFRQGMGRWLSVCLLLGILIVILGSFLRSLPHVPKIDAPLLFQPSTGQTPE
jgi:uncharacterized membrane protein